MEANHDHRKVRFQVASNVLSEPLRVPLQSSLTVADASIEILSRICKSLKISLDKAKISSLSVCLLSGQRNVLCADDILDDCLDLPTETSLFAEVVVESSSSSSAAAAQRPGIGLSQNPAYDNYENSSNGTVSPSINYLICQ